MSYRSMNVWAALVLGALGCGGSSTDAERATTSAARTLETSATAPTCTTSDLVSSTCEGSWHYREWSTCPISAGAVSEGDCLDEPSCRTFQTCSDWGFGSASNSTEVMTVQHRVRTCRSRGCFDACEEEAAAIQAALRSVQDRVPEQFRSQVSIAQRDEYEVSSRRYSPGLFESDKFDDVRECAVTIQIPTPATGQGPVCGCEQQQCTASGCGASPEEHRSDPGLALDELSARAPYLADTPAPTCSSCDPLPIDTAAAARAKLQCLESQRAAAGAGRSARFDARLRVLLTLAGDKLTPAERDVAWEAFASDRGQAPLACEPPLLEAPVLADDAEGSFAVCPASSVRALQRDLAACERLAGVAAGAVPAGVAWVLAERCVDLLERVHDARTFAGIANACVDGEFSRRARSSVAAVLRGALGALAERGSLGTPDAASAEQYPELDRSLALVDRWYAAERATLSENERNVEGDAAAARALDEMLDAFWGAAHRARRVTLDLEALLATSNPADADVGLELARAAARADRLDRDVLRAAHRVSGTAIAAVRDGGAEILQALTLQRPATRGDVLLRLTGDALTGLARTLERAEPFHDLACRIGGCGPLAPTANLARTPLGTLWRALAALDREATGAADPDALASVVQQLPAATPWRAPLQAIAANQAALRAAVSAAGADGASLERADAQRLAPAATRLAALVRAAGGRARSFGATGLLSLRAGRRIDANVSADGRRATLDALDAANLEFAADVQRFQSDRSAALAEALQRSASERSQLAIQQRLRQLDTTLERLNADALGLSASLLALDQGLGATAQRVTDSAGALDSGAFVQVGDTRRFLVHGHDAAAAVQVERQALPIARFAASGIELGSAGTPSIAVDAGRQVLVSASGEYSPLCALSRQGSDRSRRFFAGFSGLVSAVVPALALSSANQDLPLSLEPNPGTTIGPEGFQLVHQSSSTRAQARDKDFKDSGGVTGILGIVGRALPGIGSVIGGFLDQIDPIEDSSSASQQDLVSFHGGLRLPETPFPSLPAGALLLVELPRGQTDSRQIRAVHLVQRPSSSFVVSADADLYFVVNDHWVADDAECQQLSPPSDRNGVSVLVRLAAPSTEIAARSIDARHAVSETLRARRAELLRQGRILPTQLAQLRAEATLELEAQLGIELGALPGALRSLIEAQLARELSAIDIAVARQALARAASDTTLEASTLLRDLELQQSSARFATLATVWGLRSFAELKDGARERGLLQAARGLVARTAETLLPILELWHPEPLGIARANGLFQQDLLALAGVVPETDPGTLVDEVQRLIQRLRSAYESDPIPRLPNPPEQPVVGVSFRRPAQWGGGCSRCVESSTGFPEASEDRALAVWSAIESALRGAGSLPGVRCGSDADCASEPGLRCQSEAAEPRCLPAPTRVDFGVEAADIYRASGGQATLPCRLATPVVQQWALLFANPADDIGLEQLSQSGRTLEARAGATQTFVTESGAVDVTMTEPSALASGISLLYARDEAAFQRFQTLANNRLLLGRNPVGLSAFAQLSVDFAPLGALRSSLGNGIGQTPDRRVSELVLLLRLDARAFASSPPGRELEGVVTSCSRSL